MTMMPLIMSLSMITSMVFMSLNHPMAMGMTLLVQSTLIATLTGVTMKSFWFSYVLFMIFMGGMMVLFIYMASLTPNEMFSLTSPWAAITMLLSTLIIITAMDTTALSMNYTLIESSPSDLHPSSKTTITKIYSPTVSVITTLIITYLFLTLIVVVKITNMWMGPLRLKK